LATRVVFPLSDTLTQIGEE